MNINWFFLFWEVVKSNSFREVIKNLNEDIDFILDTYISCKIHEDQAFKLTSKERSFLLDYIQNLSLQKLTFPYELPSKEIVRTITTRGDGSCGFHALLGLKVNGNVVCDKVDIIRRNFCVGLKKLFITKELPECVTTQLSDIFLNPSKEDYKKIIENVLRLKNKEHGENKKSITDFFNDDDAFVKDPIVFKAYLNQLKKTDYYISQQELIAAAIVFNKRVRLFQDGWGNDSKNLSEDVLNPEGNKEVCIYYSPKGKHYERVEIDYSKLDSWISKTFFRILFD